MTLHGRSAAVGIGIALAAAATFAQQAPPRPAPAAGTGLILGQVVDADTGRGIPSVLVVIVTTAAPQAPVGELTEARPPAVPAPTAAGARRTLTAADGRFVFRDLPKGRFTIAASAPAYGAGVYGQLR